jgi:hypothetical protein
VKTVLNLVRDPWIPVFREGKIDTVSPIEAIATPGLVPALHPYEELPALRFLLFLLGWAFQGEDEEEVALLPGEELALGVEERVKGFLEAFDLDGDAFFLRGEGEIPWEGPEVLRPDWPSRGGEPALLTRPRGVPAPLRLSPAETARALLAHLAYATPGLYGKLGVKSLSASPLTQGVAFYALGRDLATTLRLNLVVPERLEAPWEKPAPKHSPLNLYLHPGRRYALRFAGGHLEAVRIYPGLPVPRLPDPMKVYREEGGNLLELRVREGESLAGAILPQLAQYAPPLVLEKGALREDLLGPYALRAVAQVADQARVIALLSESFPPLASGRERFRLRLGEAAWALGEVLKRVGEGLGEKGTLEGGRASGPFLFEAKRRILGAESEEEGRRALFSLFLRHLETYLAPRLKRRPRRVLEVERWAKRRAMRILGGEA